MFSEAVGALELFKVVVAEAVQPPAAVTVTEYVPAAKLVALVVPADTEVPPPVTDQTVLFIVPLLNDTVNAPLLWPHVGCVADNDAVGAVDAFNVLVADAVQPPAAVTVTVYVPADKLVALVVPDVIAVPPPVAVQIVLLIVPLLNDTVSEPLFWPQVGCVAFSEAVGALELFKVTLPEAEQPATVSVTVTL